ncbi:PREDICTED: CRIB domain-containing protein RIC6 [Fragaria vesca subsp. vesca]|uniref:CRIB domain-containing protein RIC6 n=1 Tax=Fragaria vesca subsp. vesca TaxID=101020 RepID=UPI0002C3780A|nr:PREDICTED: CRIB domain-containing protein RIC6 [Fragaria vesca subsp. vesca]
MSNKENSSKMKGLLKGLRYISQIFDDNKEQEIQIGFPTDVKHVAHIGWDGPATATSSPSWMNEFQSPPGFASAPLSQNGEMREDNPIKWVSEDSSRRSSRSSMSPVHESPEVPKQSRRQSSRGHEGGVDSPKSPKREKSDKHRQTRRPSRRDSSETSRASHQEATDTSTESSLPDIPKKSRRKKSKESAPGGSKKIKDPETPPATKCNSIEPQNSFQEGEDNGCFT